MPINKSIILDSGKPIYTSDRIEDSDISSSLGKLLEEHIHDIVAGKKAEEIVKRIQNLEAVVRMLAKKIERLEKAQPKLPVGLEPHYSEYEGHVSYDCLVDNVRCLIYELQGKNLIDWTYNSL